MLRVSVSNIIEDIIVIVVTTPVLDVSYWQSLIISALSWSWVPSYMQEHQISNNLCWFDADLDFKSFFTLSDIWNDGCFFFSFLLCATIHSGVQQIRPTSISTKFTAPHRMMLRENGFFSRRRPYLVFFVYHSRSAPPHTSNRKLLFSAFLNGMWTWPFFLHCTTFSHSLSCSHNFSHTGGCRLSSAKVCGLLFRLCACVPFVLRQSHTLYMFIYHWPLSLPLIVLPLPCAQSTLSPLCSPLSTPSATFDTIFLYALAELISVGGVGVWVPHPIHRYRYRYSYPHPHPYPSNSKLYSSLHCSSPPLYSHHMCMIRYG